MISETESEKSHAAVLDFLNFFWGMSFAMFCGGFGVLWGRESGETGGRERGERCEGEGRVAQRRPGADGGEGRVGERLGDAAARGRARQGGGGRVVFAGQQGATIERSPVKRPTVKRSTVERATIE